MRTTLMLDANDIPLLTSFDGNIDTDKLKPFIYLAQKNDIKNILGLELYKKILEDYETRTLEGIYDTIYKEYVIEMLVFFSCSKYMAFGGYKTSNNGIHKTSYNGAQVVDYKEVAILISRYDQLATNIETSFYEFMKDPEIYNLVPEYKLDNEDKKENQIIPWY